MCFGNQHTFTWSSGTAVDAMPLSLRCLCGAMSREDIAPLQNLQAENERLRSALTGLKRAIEHAVEGKAVPDLGQALSTARAALTSE